MKPGRFIYPRFLPGGEDFLFLFMPEGADWGEVYLATLRGGKAVNPTLLLRNDTAASYTPAGGGRVLFVRNDNLYSQKLDRKGRKMAGDAELLQQDVASTPGNRLDRAEFSVSLNGVIAWRPGKAALSRVTMFDRSGKEIGTAGPLLPINSVALSPDETRVCRQRRAVMAANPRPVRSQPEPGNRLVGPLVSRWLTPARLDGHRTVGPALRQRSQRNA